MKWEPAVLAGLAACVSAAPQGVTENIAPQGNSPAGCSPTFSGKFQISIHKGAAPAVSSHTHSQVSQKEYFH